MIFSLMKRVIDPDMPEKLALSVFSTAIPGRIYAEVPTFQQAVHLARTTSDLNATRIRPVPLDEYFRVLRVINIPKPCKWARIKGKKKKWHLYQGDTGIVIKVKGRENLIMYLIPRLVMTPLDEVLSRPPQELVDRLRLQNMVEDNAVSVDEDGCFEYDGFEYNADGLMMFNVDDVNIVPLAETLPTAIELAIFKATTVLGDQMANATNIRLRQRNMKVGDRVKVVMGEYSGLVGELTEVTDEEVKVYLPSQDITEDIRKNNVRAYYQVGDQVKVVCGQYSGLIAWIISIAPDTLRIVNIEKETEVSIRPYIICI